MRLRHFAAAARPVLIGWAGAAGSRRKAVGTIRPRGRDEPEGRHDPDVFAKATTNSTPSRKSGGITSASAEVIRPCR